MTLKSAILFTIFQIMLVTVVVAQKAQTQHRVIKIEFITLTRGAHEHVILTKDSVKVEKQSLTDEKETRSGHKLNHQAWINLLNALHNVPLQDVPMLKSPTNDRAFDGAHHSTIIITIENGQSVTHSFDNEKPNEKLKSLMVAIRKNTKAP